MSKFRFEDASYDSQGICRLNLGLTDYKSYIGTNLSPQWKVFYEEGLKCGNESSYFANPLGNQCILVLRDGNHILLNRGTHVAEDAGLIACIGGHPEPSAIGMDSNHLKDPNCITDELFNSAYREVIEETNIQYFLTSPIANEDCHSGPDKASIREYIIINLQNDQV